MNITFKFQKMESDKQNFEAFKVPRADPPLFRSIWDTNFYVLKAPLAKPRACLEKNRRNFRCLKALNTRIRYLSDIFCYKKTHHGCTKNCHIILLLYHSNYGTTHVCYNWILLLFWYKSAKWPQGLLIIYFIYAYNCKLGSSNNAENVLL